MQPNATVIRFLLPGLLALACGLGAGMPALFAVTAPPAVALAPLVRSDPDARPGEPESLTPLVQAGLSEDPRWRMVERDQLGALEAEWAFAQSGFASSAVAVRQGRLIGAALILICRPEPGDLTKPSATCEVVDAVTAEPLASAPASLTDRPFARWYRNPPPADVHAIVEAFKTALAEALAVRASETDLRLVTPLYFDGPPDLVGQLESALAGALARESGWRVRRALRLDASRAEALLAASGIVRGHDPQTGAYLWGALETRGAAADLALRYHIWQGSGNPTEHLARGNAASIAAEITQTLQTSAASAAADTDPARIGETRLDLARQMTAEARALASGTGLADNTFFSRLPGHMVHEPLRAHVLRLLASAALLAPADADTQELWLRTAFNRQLSFSVTWQENHPPFANQPLTADALRLRRELVAFADAFWRRPDGSLDLRLLQLAYAYAPERLAAPDMPGELRRHATLIGRPPREQLEPHRTLLRLWLNALEVRCPEYKRIQQLGRDGTLKLEPSAFNPPPAEIADAFDALWPLFQALRDSTPPLHVNVGLFHAAGSPRFNELLANQSAPPARAGPQPLVVSSQAPSLIPPVRPLAKNTASVEKPDEQGKRPPANPPASTPDMQAIRRLAAERRAYMESIKDKTSAEQERLARDFHEKQRTELDRIFDQANQTNAAGAAARPASTATPPPPIIDVGSIPGLTAETRVARLREACRRPGQLTVVRALVQAGADPLDGSRDQSPPLLIAIETRQESYVDALLDARPDLDRRWAEANTHGPAGVYLLHAAIARDLPAVARRLLDAVPDQVKGIHARDSDSLLNIAIKHGDIELVRRLSRLGASLSESSDDALVAIARRCRHATDPASPQTFSLDYVRQVLELLRETDPNAINRLQDGSFGNSESPLLVAVQRRNHELVEALIAAGASLNAGWTSDRRSVADLAASDVVMQRLLQGQSLARARTGGAAAAGPDGAEIVARLARLGTAALANVKLTPELLAYRDAKKWTLLHHAIGLRDEAQSLRLIAAGAPLEAASIGGQTPLTFAVFKRLPRVVEALLARGAKPDGRGNDTAITPLRAATINRDLDLMRRLIDAGADLNQTVYDDRMPLLCAVIWQDEGMETIRLLVDSGARLDTTNYLGYGPLEHAIGKNRVDVLEYLYAKGVRQSRPTDAPDYTPVRFALQNNSREALRFLLSHGERDPGALAVATDPEMRALVSDAMQQDSGGKAFADEELWPAICKDLERWRERMDAHLASGGNVNYGSMDWTPLILAINESNLPMVRYLLTKGANPKTLPQRNRNKPDWDLSDTGILRLAWNRHYISRKGRFDEPTFAEIVKVILPLNPADDNQWLFLLMLKSRLWIAADAFVQAGIQPTPYMKETIISEGRLKGPDLARALSILEKKPPSDAAPQGQPL